MLSSMLGFAATATSSVKGPSQIINVFKNRMNPVVLNGVSVWTILLIISSSGLWSVYGLRFDAFWTTALAAIDIVVYVLISMILMVWAKKWWVPIMALGASLVFISIAMHFTQNALGIIGSIFSTLMFIPQAVRIYRVRGTNGIYGYSFFSSVMLIVSSLFWIAYAVSLNDIWVGIYAPLAIVSGAAMIWVRLRGVDDEKA